MNGYSPLIRLKTVTEKYRRESDFTRITLLYAPIV
jgi:hypothetical protein